MPELTAPTRQQKITLGEMRSSGVRGLLVYCADYHCSHSIAIGADQWPEHLRLSDLEARFVCKACGQRGADVRTDFNWNKQPVAESCSRSPLGENLSCFLQSLELFSALNS